MNDKNKLSSIKKNMSSAIDLQTKLRKRLEALLKLPENQVCCDCNRRGTIFINNNNNNCIKFILYVKQISYAILFIDVLLML